MIIMILISAFPLMTFSNLKAHKPETILEIFLVFGKITDDHRPEQERKALGKVPGTR
jgi:hypothetical protein